MSAWRGPRWQRVSEHGQWHYRLIMMGELILTVTRAGSRSYNYIIERVGRGCFYGPRPGPRRAIQRAALLAAQSLIQHERQNLTRLAADLGLALERAP